MNAPRQGGGGVLSRGRRGVTERADDLDLIMAALIQLIFEAAENSLSGCGLAQLLQLLMAFLYAPMEEDEDGRRVAQIVTFVCASNPVALQPRISQFRN